ncbi:MAG: TIGR04255 family protein [Ferrimicrobium sp.]
MERFMMFGLDAVPRYRLARPPLVQAFGQVRFPVRAKLPTLEGVAPVQQRLDSLFPYMRKQQMQQVSLLVGPAGAASAQSQPAQTWHFSDDIGWSLTLSADTATLGVGSQYGEFSEFSDRFQAVLSTLAEDVGVTRADRLGIRYINIAEVLPGNSEPWHSWFRPEMTGWVATDIIGEGTQLVTSITQSQFSAQAPGGPGGPQINIQAFVRHGLIPANTMVPGVLPVQPPGPAFFLDIDLFVEFPQPFDAEELSRQLTMLHDQIDRFFFWTITQQGAKHFGLEVLA